MRRLLTPRWLAWHALLLLAVLACLGLGWWQLDRAESATGTWQNVIYAVQWPLFAILIVYAWIRAAYLELRPPDERPPEPLSGSIVVWLRPPRHAAVRGAGDRPMLTGGYGGAGSGAELERTARLDAAQTAPAPTDPEDAAEEQALAEYNRYLAAIRVDER